MLMKGYHEHTIIIRLAKILYLRDEAPAAKATIDPTTWKPPGI